MAAEKDATFIIYSLYAILIRNRENITHANDLLKRETEYYERLSCIIDDNHRANFKSEFNKMEYIDHRLDTSKELCSILEEHAKIGEDECEIWRALEKNHDDLYENFYAVVAAINEKIDSFSIAVGDTNA